MIPEWFMLLRVLIGAGLGALVGLERERQNQPAGLRTHIILVSGSALAMTLSINLSDASGDPARLAAQVLSGIGFLGAGAILRFGPNVKGLTTATSLWTMAVVGLAVGAGYYWAAAGVTILLLVVLRLLNILEARLNPVRAPLQISLIAADRPGVTRTVRQILEEHAQHVDTFRVYRQVRRQRIRIQGVIHLRKEYSVENLADTLSALDGVRAVRYE